MGDGATLISTLRLNNRFNMLGFFIAALGVIFGAGSIAVDRFERSASADILSKLRGEHARVTVQTKLNGLIDGPLGDVKLAVIRARNFATDGLPLFTEPWRSQRGIVRELRIELRDFDLGKLRIEALDATIPDCRYDYALAQRKQVIRLSKSGVGQGSVRIRQESLEKFILAKFKEIKSVSVKIEKDKVFVEGHGEFVIVKTDFLVIATLGSPDGRTIELQNPRILFDGKPADELAKKALLDTLNPVVDLNADLKLHDAISVKHIRLSDGVLEAWGETRIPESPEPAG